MRYYKSGAYRLYRSAVYLVESATGRRAGVSMTDWKWVLSRARKAYFAVLPRPSSSRRHHSAVASVRRTAAPPSSRPADAQGHTADWPSATAWTTVSDLGLPALLLYEVDRSWAVDDWLRTPSARSLDYRCCW